MNKLDALKGIASATTLRKIKEILGQVDQNPSPEFTKQEEKAQAKRMTRYLLVIVALAFIGAVTYLAWIGGDYIFAYAGFIALFFGILDAALILLLAGNVIKGKARYGILIFEIGSLLYLGYAMSGYFGGGNLKTAAETKLMKDYEIVNHYRTSAQTIAEQATRAAQNAKQVADIEFARDGKGVVYEKGTMMAGMKIDSIPIIKPLRTIPDFTSIVEANKFLHVERQKLAEQITGIKSVASSIQQQAAGIDAGLTQAIAMGLSSQQMNNLQVLSGTLQAITKTQIVDEKIADDVLTPQDLQADGFQKYIGYIIDIIIIFFIVMIALQKEDSEDIEKIRESEAKALISEILSDETIPFDSDRVSQAKFKHLHEAIKTIMSDDVLKTYVRKNMSFNEFLEFMREHPVVAKSLGGTKWAYRDIMKEINSNEEFLSYAQDAIKLSPSAWKAVAQIIPDPSMVLEMEEGQRKTFSDMLINLTSKLQRPEKVKEFMGKFVKAYDSASPTFLKTLEICIEKLPAKQLVHLTPDFVKNISPEIAEHLCPLIDSDSTYFELITRSWKEQTTDEYSEVLQNGVIHQPQFHKLWKVGIQYGGLDGLLAMIQAYHEKKKECESTSIGSKTVSIEPNFGSIQTAMTNGNSDEFLKAVKDSFIAKPKMVSLS